MQIRRTRPTWSSPRLALLAIAQIPLEKIVQKSGIFSDGENTTCRNPHLPHIPPQTTSRNCPDFAATPSKNAVSFSA
jgi:hypothetical protein